jgi:hypothetical protein
MLVMMRAKIEREPRRTEMRTAKANAGGEHGMHRMRRSRDNERKSKVPTKHVQPPLR